MKKLKKRNPYILSQSAWAVLVLIVLVFVVISKITESGFLEMLSTILILLVIVYIIVIFLLEFLRDVISVAD